VGTDPTQRKGAWALALTMRGTPFLFEGEELGYTNACWDPGSFDEIQTKVTYDLALKDGCSALVP
jgi:glycosidase